METRTSDTLQLQDRYSKSDVEDSNRSGRLLSQMGREEDEGFEENILSGEIRVESVEVYEREHNESSFEGFITDKERNQGYIELYDFEVEDEHEYFAEGVLVHNCHHLHDMSSNYAKTLQILTCPVKIGTTATLPATPEGKMIMEALLGPVLKTYTVNEANNEGILAKPIVKIIPQIPLHPSVLAQRFGFGESGDPVLAAYQRVYYNGIVINADRNLTVLEEAWSRVKQGKSVLINVIQLAHIEALMNMASTKFPKFNIEAINSNIKKEDRDLIKERFKSKDLKCVIATVSWAEGVDIPSLDCCINAAAGKSEIATLQKIGRGLRKTNQKSEVEIVDFKDVSHEFLFKHFKERYKIYKANKWVE